MLADNIKVGVMSHDVIRFKPAVYQLTEFTVAYLTEALRYEAEGSGFDFSRSQWPRSLRRGSEADRLLGLRV